MLFIKLRFTPLMAVLTGILLMVSLVSHQPVTSDSGAFIIIDTTKKDPGWPAKFGIGRTPTAAEIAAWDLDVRPDGKGLPVGWGTVAAGKVVYLTKCASCHGATGEEMPGVTLPAPALVSDTAFVGRKLNTIGNYWPYATTLFDYIRRAMPYSAPGSLTANETYSLTAYLLHANKLIAQNKLINAHTLPKVAMPALKHYYIDDRKGGAEVK